VGALKNFGWIGRDVAVGQGPAEEDFDGCKVTDHGGAGEVALGLERGHMIGDVARGDVLEVAEGARSVSRSRKSAE